MVGTGRFICSVLIIVFDTTIMTNRSHKRGEDWSIYELAVVTLQRRTLRFFLWLFAPAVANNHLRKPRLNKRRVFDYTTITFSGGKKTVSGALF
jgi:hypothetical protein